MAVDRVVRVSLVLDTGQFEAGLNKANTSLTGLEKTVGRISRSMMSFVAIWAGRELMKGISDAVKGAADFEYQLALVQRASEMSTADIGRLSGELINMSVALGQPIEQLSQLAIGAGRAGVDTVEAMTKIADTASKMSMITGMGAEDVSINLIKLSRAFNLPLSDVDKLASAIAYAGKETTATEEDIIKAMTRMASSGNMLGMTADQLITLAAIAVDSGVLASRAGTEWQSAFTTVIDKANIAGPLLGKTAGEFKAMANKDFESTLILLANAINQVSNRTDALNIATDLFGKQGLKVIGPLLTHMEKLATLMPAVAAEMEKGAYLQQAAAALMATFEFHANQAAAALKTMGMQIGASVLPALIPVVDAIKEFATNKDNIDAISVVMKNLATTLNDLLPAIQAIIKAFGLFVGMISDAVAGARFLVNYFKELGATINRNVVAVFAKLPGVLGDWARSVLPEMEDNVRALTEQTNELGNAGNFVTDNYFNRVMDGFKQLIPQAEVAKTNFIGLGNATTQMLDSFSGFNAMQGFTDQLSNFGQGAMAGYGQEQIGESTLGPSDPMFLEKQIAQHQETINQMREMYVNWYTEKNDMSLAQAANEEMTLTYLMELQKNVSTGFTQLWTGALKTFSTSFATNMTAVIMGQKSAAEAFKSIWQDLTSFIINLILQIITQLLVMIALMAAAKAFGLQSGGLIPGFKGGGIIPKMQAGGMVPGYGIGDRVPALLEPGELVIPKDKVGDVVNNNQKSVNVNVSLAGAMVMDDPKTVSRLYREHLRDVIRGDVWGERDRFYG